MPKNLETTDFAELYAKEWVTPKELELIYGFSISSQGKMRMSSHQSTIPFSKINGKYIRYSITKINTWLEEHQVQGN